MKLDEVYGCMFFFGLDRALNTIVVYHCPKNVANRNVLIT